MHALSCIFVCCCVIRVSDRLVNINYHPVFRSQSRILVLVFRPWVKVIMEERLGGEVCSLLIRQYGGLMIDTTVGVCLFKFVAAECDQ